jgi:hypothetical protein
LDGKADNPDPADNETDVAVNAKTLDWDDMPNATGYIIKVGTTTGGTEIVPNGTSATSDYTVSNNWTPNTEYFWTVTCTIDGSDYSGNEWSFTTLDAIADNPSPADGATYVATNTTYDWDDIPGATSYTIDIGTGTGLSDIVNDAVCYTSNYTLASSLSTENTYYWTVTSIINGSSYEGNEWSFTTSTLFNNEISSLEDLKMITQNTGFWAADLVQTANIDATETQYWDYSDDDGDLDRYNDENDANSTGTNDGWLPIGNYSTTSFSGSYDGGNHTISNLVINRTAGHQGFFGYVTGSVSNLSVTDLNYTISGSSWGVGGLAGAVLGSNSLVTNCHSSGSITSEVENTGGLLGYLGLGVTTNCSSSVNIDGNGGLERGGGLIGFSSGQVSNSYSTGNVINILQSAGGFIAILYYDNVPCSITNCYSTGNVSRASASTFTVYIGAFVGFKPTQAEITNCYATGTVTFENAADPLNKGFTNNSTNTSNNFWNSTTSNQTSATGATALTNSEMQDYTNFTTAGWDFYHDWSISPTYNNGWPNLDDEAETINWTGTSGTAWSTGGNWDGDIAPIYIQNARVPSSGVTQFPVIGTGEGYNIKGLTVNSGASLTIESGGSLITWGEIADNSTVDMNRTISDGQWHLVSVPASGITANTFNGDYLQSWDETTGDWTEITNPGTTLNTNQGYLLWGVAKGSYTFSGTPLTGDQSKAVSYTAVEESGYDGANLLGNPYPSSIDWSGLDDTWGAVYYYNGTGYVSWNNGEGSGSQYIPPMQGFFIVVDAYGTFELTNDNRSNSGATGYYKSGNELSNGIILEASNGEYRDALHILLRDETTDGFDLQHDAWKFLSDAEGISEIYSFAGDDRLSIDARPEIQELQLGFANDKAGVYSIGMREMNGIPNAYLEDTKTGIFHNLQSGAYQFSWDPFMDDENRFKLHLNAVGIQETSVTESDILIWSANRQIYIKGADAGKVTVLDVMGRVILQKEISDNESISVPVNLQSGIYLVTVHNGKEIKTGKVFIK